MGIQTGYQKPKNHPLIIVNSVGLVVMAVWGYLAYRAVKHEDRALAWVLTVFLPAMYILPIVDIVIGALAGKSNLSYRIQQICVPVATRAGLGTHFVLDLHVHCGHCCKLSARLVAWVCLSLVWCQQQRGMAWAPTLLMPGTCALPFVNNVMPGFPLCSCHSGVILLS